MKSAGCRSALSDGVLITVFYITAFFLVVALVIWTFIEILKGLT